MTQQKLGQRAPKNVLMVAPLNFQGTFWDFSEVMRVLDKKAQNPPLPLLLVAGMLPRDRYTIRLVDMQITSLKQEDIAWADIVFVSALSTAAKGAAEVLQRAQSAGRTAVMGGPHAIAFYASTPNVDCFVLGEAEVVWAEFLADLDAGSLKKAYAVPSSPEERETFLAHFGAEALVTPSGCLPDMDLAPVPRYDLLEMDQYYFMALQTTRGCPSQCEFCDIWRRYGRKPRNRSVEKVLEDLNELYRLGWRGIVLFSNDNLIGDKPYAKELLTAIARWQVEHRRPFRFKAEASLNIADDQQLLELFEAAGVNAVFVGLETPCAESLNEARKLINLKGDMASRVAIIQKHGLDVMAGFIIGFDSDPADIDVQMVASLQEMGISFAMVGLLTALPNSDLFDRMEQEGRLLLSRLGPLGYSNPFVPNFQTARPLGEVVASYRNVLDTLYANDMKGYFERCTVFLKHRATKRKKLREILAEVVPDARPLVPEAQPVKAKQSLLTQFRMLFRVACLFLPRPYGGNAFRFLMAARRNRAKDLHYALGLVAIGHHFWATTRTYLQAAAVLDVLKDRLHFLYASQGLDLPEMLCPLGIHSKQAGTVRVAAGAAPMGKEQAEQRKKVFLQEAAEKYGRLSHGSQALIESEYQLFCQGVALWADRACSRSS